MSKRVSGTKGQKSKNRCGKYTRYGNYLQLLHQAENSDATMASIEKVKQIAMSAKNSISKIVPRGASKFISSLVRQRT